MALKFSYVSVIWTYISAFFYNVLFLHGPASLESLLLPKI